MERSKKSFFRRHFSRQSKKSVTFELVNFALVTALCLILLYPFVYMLAVSLSSKGFTADVVLFPIGFNTSAYTFILGMDNILSGFKNTLVYTFTGLIVSMFLTVCMAYAMSKKFLVGKKAFNIVVLVTMYFSGGLIPTYILIAGMGMVDTVWAMIIPGAVNTYNMIVMRTFFMSTVPTELEEAAEIDGAGTLRVLWEIYLPLSMPILVTIALFYFVAGWNAWFGAQIYMRTESKFPIQLVLRRALETSLAQGLNSGQMADLYALGIDGKALNYALTIIVTAPLLILFPFLQKFFVKGVMVGSLKG